MGAENVEKHEFYHMNFRVGIGYDVHQLIEGRPLILGGITIPHSLGLAGHSDADVLLHAISDALLGAAALGDIGVHFPDSDDKWKGANSRELLRSVNMLLSRDGYHVVNVDATVALERPKIRTYIDRMRQVISEDLGIQVSQVSVKATTSEGLGMVGHEEGVAAWAVGLLSANNRS